MTAPKIVNVHDNTVVNADNLPGKDRVIVCVDALASIRDKAGMANQGDRIRRSAERVDNGLVEETSEILVLLQLARRQRCFENAYAALSADGQASGFLCPTFLQRRSPPTRARNSSALKVSGGAVSPKIPHI